MAQKQLTFELIAPFDENENVETLTMKSWNATLYTNALYLNKRDLSLEYEDDVESSNVSSNESIDVHSYANQLCRRRRSTSTKGRA